MGDEIGTLLIGQRNFFESGATKNIAFRKEQLRKLYRLVKENEQLLCDAVYKDFKKSGFDTFASELGLILQEISLALKHLDKWARPTKVRTNLVNFPGSSKIMAEPLGVSLIFSTWNYPYLLSLQPAISAIAAGNTVVLKPSEILLYSSRALADLINDNFDPGIFHVLEGGIELSSRLISEKFDKIFFTGSTKVGKIVYEAAAKNLVPVTLELGGKSPAIITPDCNLKMTAKRLVWAKFVNAGQTCISPDYVVVHKSIKDEFIQEVLDEIKRSEFDPKNDNYVSIVNKDHFTRLKTLIDKSADVRGGNSNEKELVIYPAVLVGVNWHDPVMDEEIFGPLLPVIEYDNLQELIDTIKQKPKPLSCYVFTGSRKTAKTLITELPFGGGAINEAIMQITNSRLPFGGVGASGIGAYHGYEGFKAFSHLKSILDKPTWFELPLKYSPRTKRKLSLIRFLLR